MEGEVVDAFQEVAARRMELEAIEIQEEVVVVIDSSGASLEAELVASMGYSPAKYSTIELAILRIITTFT
jgi:predicted dinucleotide-binding enzyme